MTHNLPSAGHMTTKFCKNVLNRLKLKAKEKNKLKIAFSIF